ncbi:MAG: CPBP family intramembrane metalloprotease [Planctomycetes bacterium]|nr:CPBP family intramembrane metalloprotease [Planctomycetota bacterium]
MYKITAGKRIYAETAVSLIVVITAIKLTRIIPFLSTKWYLTPAILLTAALIPTLIKKQNPIKTLLPLKNIWLSVSLLSVTCIIVFPLLYIALLLLKHWPIIEPFFPIPWPRGQVPNWIIYNFLYIAVFEELFFRAYIQSNIQRALDPQLAANPDRPKKLNRHHWTAITVSSAAFTAAHMIIHADPMAILVFLPAMIFGWLYAKTNSIIAPILFHGISNTAYCLIVYFMG